MKALSTLLIAVLVLLPLAACGGGAQEAAATGYSPAEISLLLIDSQESVPEMYAVTMEESGFSDILSAYYNIAEDMLEDGVICYANGANATEFTVFKLRSAGDSGAVRDLLLDYIEARIAEFYGYSPDQVYLLEQAVVEVNGSHVALLVCEDPQQALATFADCFRGDGVREDTLRISAALSHVTTGQTAPRDDYDHDAVLAAWQTGDRTGLSFKNLRILNAATAVVDEIIADGMTDYEKELAVHDWIVQWADYDMETKSRSPTARPNPDNDNPYGVLIGQRAICTGYTTTFQLFMDMLDVPCITVHGTARDGGSDHAWNMVLLDDAWYCVDVTWDDPTDLVAYDAVIQHRYFNVTSEVMRESDHQWNELEVPLATETLYAWPIPD